MRSQGERKHRPLKHPRNALNLERGALRPIQSSSLKTLLGLELHHRPPLIWTEAKIRMKMRTLTQTRNHQRRTGSGLVGNPGEAHGEVDLLTRGLFGARLVREVQHLENLRTPHPNQCPRGRVRERGGHPRKQMKRRATRSDSGRNQSPLLTSQHIRPNVVVQGRSRASKSIPNVFKRSS